MMFHEVSAERTSDDTTKMRPRMPNDQVRSGQGSCKVIWTWKYIYSIQRIIQKLPTKFHANRTVQPRVITVDTQISSGHLIIFAVYLHIKTSIFKSLEVPDILFGTIYGDVSLVICYKRCCFLSRQKYLKMRSSTWPRKVKGQSEVITLLWLTYWWLDS